MHFGEGNLMNLQYALLHLLQCLGRAGYIHVCVYIYIYIYGHPPSQGLPAGGGVSHMYLHLHLSTCGTCKNHCKYQCFFEYAVCKIISIAIICLKKHPIMQNQNPVLHFQKFHQKMKTLCTNSEVHHQKTQGTCIFSNKQHNLT